MIKRTMALALGAAALACALASPAAAQTPPVPTTVGSVQDVAWNMRAQFANGTATGQEKGGARP